MRKALVCLVALAFSACDCGGDNNGGSDAGFDAAPNNGVEEDVGPEPDGASNNGLDMGAPDMALPDGVSIEGLTGAVTVRFDAQGVLHVECEVSDDCFAVQGYYHAAHRFIQMDVQRRFATGRLAGLIGNAALPVDVSTRALMSTRDGQPLEEALWEAAGDDTRAGITAYTRGVNAWIADLRAGRNGAKLSEEYELELVDPEIVEWTETDSVASGLLLLETLSNSSGGDISRGIDFPKLSPEQAFDILGTMSATNAATMPASGETYDRVQALLRRPDARELLPALDRLLPHQNLLAEAQARIAEMDAFAGKQDDKGSNNWVIGGDLTTSGMPILANDPHLGLQNPTLWYLVELHATGAENGLHTTGVSLPGLPGILLGHNENISWGATVVYWDLADVYVEELTSDGSAVMFNGNPVNIVEVEHEFDVARSNPVTRTLRFVPHHGPVLNYDAGAGTALSLRWTGNDARTDLDMFFGLMTASTVDEARTAVANSTSTNQNWIVADRTGDIGWFPFNAVPERPWASLETPPWLPLPGDGSAEWGPRIPVDELPQMVNPTNGFVATANTDPLGTSFDGDPTNEAYGYLYSYGEFAGFRQQAIEARILEAGTAHTPEISMEMQGDSFLVLRDWIVPHVQTVVDGATGPLSADATALWAALESWDGTCPTGLEGRDPEGAKSAEGAAASIGCTAFHYLLFALTEEVFADELAETNAGHGSLYAIRTLVVLLNDPARLAAPDAYWDDVLTDGPPETREMNIISALDLAGSRIRTDMGADSDDWRWGRVHTLLMFANVFSNAGFTQYNHGPFAAPGGAFAINVANSRNGAARDWGFSSGPSMRHVSEFTAEGITSYWTLPGGQRHFRDSPHYDDLLDDWLNVRHFEMPFTEAEVETAAVETVSIVPQ